jgi:hypothetical protein
MRLVTIADRRSAAVEDAAAVVPLVSSSALPHSAPGEQILNAMDVTFASY